MTLSLREALDLSTAAHAVKNDQIKELEERSENEAHAVDVAQHASSCLGEIFYLTGESCGLELAEILQCVRRIAGPRRGTS